MPPDTSPAGTGAPIWLTWARQGVTVYMDGARFYGTPDTTRRHA